jgi:nitrite reductase/ring-hydroxylating ferredoxin subunit
VVAGMDGKGFISVAGNRLLRFSEGFDGMDFARAASTKDLEPGNMMGVEVWGKEVLLVNLGGTFYAIGNRCTHMSCLLSEGTLEGESVKCVCHDSFFEVKTGKVAKGPARKPEPVFQVKVEGDQVLIGV